MTDEKRKRNKFIASLDSQEKKNVKVIGKLRFYNIMKLKIGWDMYEIKIKEREREWTI